MAIVAISGSNGFIGGHLKERLEKMGHVVIPIERSLRLSPANLILFHSQYKPEYIFDCAAYGNHYFQTDEDEVVKANVRGVYNMLQSIRQFKSIKGYFNFSTTSHNLESGTFYGSTKSSGEYIARAFVRKYDLPIVNIRPYSVFGEREWEFRFIPTLCKRLKNAQDITVSRVEHDWIYIEDFLDGLIDVMENVNTLKGFSVGIGTGKRIDNMEIANRLMVCAGIRVDVKEYQKREYEIANHETMTQGEKRDDEFKYFNHAKTSLEKALWNVYTNQRFLKKK